MSYRAFDTQTWKDPWFEALSTRAKLLFIHLFTNDAVNQAGMYQISLRRIEFEVGFCIEEVMPELYAKVTWFPDGCIIWVHNFCRRQCQNASFLKAAMKSISSMPNFLRAEFYKYNKELFERYGVDAEIPECDHPDDTVSPQSDHSAVISTVQYSTAPRDISTKSSYLDIYKINTYVQREDPLHGVESNLHKPKRKKPTQTYSIEFMQFWEAYPKRKGKDDAWKAWRQRNGDRPPIEQILSAVANQRASPDWQKDGGQFIPLPATWLRAGRWADEMETAEPEPQYSPEYLAILAKQKQKESES